MEAKELKIVVSEIGEQWSPKTEAAKTVAMTLYKIGKLSASDKPEFWQIVHVIGIAIG